MRMVFGLVLVVGLALAGFAVYMAQGFISQTQSQLAAEQAIRAVRLATPFNLPPQYYDAWKRVAAFRFDKRLSQ